MQIADTDILDAFKQNVNKGGSLLFRRYYKPLILFSNSLLNDDTFSEDIVQDVFYHFINTHAYNRISPNTLATFLFRAARNLCVNKIRNTREYTYAELLSFEATEEEAITFSPELVEAIRKAIRQLPEKTRAVVLSIIVEKKKYKETAESLNVSVNTVKTLLNHGLQQLRRQFPDPAIFLFMLSQQSCL